MEFKTVAEGRRSIRKFTEEVPAKETITAVTETAIKAPSWKNSQTVRYHAVYNAELKNRIAQEATFTFSKNRDNIGGAPVLMVATTIDGISGYEPDGTPTTTKGSHWQSLDAGLSIQTFCLAAHEAGLGTVILGIFNEAKVKEILGLPEGESVSALIPVGYPAESPDPRPRKAVGEILTIHE